MFHGYYATGDGGYIDEDGYVFVMGRVDDVINVAGHRLSTGEIEEVIANHPAVAECAVIARDDDLKGQVPMGLVVLKSGVTMDEAVLQKELVTRVREAIGAITCYKDTVVLARLPKTRSGKTLRKTLCNIVNGKQYIVPSTIDDSGVIPEIIEIAAQQAVHRLISRVGTFLVPARGGRRIPNGFAVTRSHCPRRNIFRMQRGHEKRAHPTFLEGSF